MQFDATWLANVMGMDEDGLPAFGRIGADSAYRPDDAFVVGWHELLEAESLDAVPEMMWAIHNADDRPSGRTCRSMYIGDVVVVGEVAFACEAIGFRRLDAAPRHLRAGTFVEHVAALRNR
ncbi:MAG: hypothetical protein M1522_03665 [Actinobacteria bacterium]|jgi:hypothetical protein|nr:hypothetical protein [Actinomycetota bacterium]